jgi:hypothetical protein
MIKKKCLLFVGLTSDDGAWVDGFPLCSMYNFDK